MRSLVDRLNLGSVSTAFLDTTAEAIAGLMQRPGRTFLTALGTMLGVGAFVSVVGLAETANGQISRRFDALLATEVVVQQAQSVEQSDPNPASPFPSDSDSRVGRIGGVVNAGFLWTVDESGQIVFSDGHSVSSSTASFPLFGASPGLLPAIRANVAQGRNFDAFHDQNREHVVVLGSVVADELGIGELMVNQAVLIDDVPFVVIGVVDQVGRQSDVLFSGLVPNQTAAKIWGEPSVASKSTMIVDTEVGAAEVVAAQVPVALRPDSPDSFSVLPPPAPGDLRDEVISDFGYLYLILGAISLFVGAIGIANTTMISVLERVPEIGLRRAMGASRLRITGQFLLESSLMGTIGGLVGTSLATIVVVGVSIVREWTALLDPAIVLPAPLVGSVVGVLAGAYPALVAGRIEPIEALRR